MTCTEFREKLPLLVYGDLTAEERAAVESHLTLCAACRADVAALRTVRSGLDQVAAPGAVDLTKVYLRESNRQRRRTRLWQAAALLAMAAAILILVSRLDIRANERQLVVRWGAEETPTPAPPAIVVQNEAVPPVVTAEQWQDLRHMVHLLAANDSARDREHNEQVGRLRRELSEFQKENQQSQRRWSEIAREINALYTAQFGSRHSGAGQ